MNLDQSLLGHIASPTGLTIKPRAAGETGKRGGSRVWNSDAGNRAPKRMLDRGGP